MEFSAFARQLDVIEQTSKRNQLVELLADLFRQTEPDEIQSMVYLCQGRLVPFFVPLEIGMGEKMVAQAIAGANQTAREEVLDLYGKMGDLGLVAQRLSTGVNDSGINVLNVHKRLLEIATTSGEGSIEKKVGLLSMLFTEVEAVSAKHLARIPLGALRLGIGDPTLLDAFSFAQVGDKSWRKPLERAYNEVSDLGMIAHVLWHQGIAGVNQLKIGVGRPLRSQLPERLPTPEKVLEKMGPVIVQTKFDGFRTQIHKQGDKVEIFSRNLEDMTAMFPDIVDGVRRQVKAKSAIIDAESLAYNEASGEFYRFQETTRRRRKHNVDQFSLDLPLKAFVFDTLYVDGISLLDQPLSQRLATTKELVADGETLLVARSELVEESGRLQVMLNEAITAGLEGLVVKRPDSSYQAGSRNFNWVKLKRHSSGELSDTIDCVILGYIFGRGKRTALGAGALLVGVYDRTKDEFTSVSKIGTGLSDQEWQEIHARCDKIASVTKPARINSLIVPSVWVEPEVVIEVLADEITRSPAHTAGKNGEEAGYALRFPRLISFRSHDKQAEDATTVEELVHLYNQQVIAEVVE
jgi:DNA ligase-1